MSKGMWHIRRQFLEIKIGVFFFVAIILVGVLLISIRELTFFKGTYIIRVKFKFAEGLRPSSPVRFCGVDVGEVKKVDVNLGKNKPYVVVHAKVQEDVLIPSGAYFFINSLSLFGEKYLEITPPSKVIGYLKPGSAVEGVSPVPLFNVFSTFNSTMEQLQEFVQEGKVRTSVENTLSNIEAASHEAKNFMIDMQDLATDFRSLMGDLKSKQGTIGRLFYDDTLYQTTEEFISDLKAHPWKLLYKPKNIE
ncbi:MAG: MlaD family protein [Candidatus Omnitrophota bacterium]